MGGWSRECEVYTPGYGCTITILAGCWAQTSGQGTFGQAARQIARVDGESQGNSYEGRR